MPHPPRLDALLYGALILLVVGLGVRWWSQRDGVPAAPVPAVAHGDDQGAVAVEAAPPERLVVHVTGAVRRPGVFRLPAGSRVQDALERAGGVRPGADTAAINLAAKLSDGRQVVVPRRAPRGAPAAPAAAAAPTTTAGPISLSTATEAELDTLDGVGPATARKIIDYRTANGGFGSVEELAEIPGIGPKRLETLRAQVSP